LLAPHSYIFVLRAHPVRGKSHNQRNTTGEVATVAYDCHEIVRDLFPFEIFPQHKNLRKETEGKPKFYLQLKAEFS